MSGGQGWLIPRGADGGEFKYEVQFLQSIAKPLGESTKAAREIAGERAKATFKTLGFEEKTGTTDVTDAVNDFFDKWCHGLGCIADDADVIVSALTATINDFLLAETKARYQVMMLERQKQYEKDHPVSTWLEGHGISGEQKAFRGRLEPTDSNGQAQGQAQDQAQGQGQD